MPRADLGAGAGERASLRIALTADPELPVPPRLYGGIERIVDLLARALVARGHEVTLFAHPDSDRAGRRLVPWPGRNSRSVSDTARNSAALATHVFRGEFDLVHSFSRVAYLTPILPLRVPKLMTYQRDISPRTTSLGHALSRGGLWFTAIAHHMLQGVNDVGTWRVVYNAVDLQIYDFADSTPADAPLAFLGRIEPIKGPHLAIEIARRSGSRLVMAGNVPNEHKGFFEAEIAPHIDGDRVRYLGPVDDAEKNEFLGQARGFLMPIVWEEPFGIVMAEAMACGTPVLGFRRGAAPEVVADGVTGFIGDTVDDLVDAVGRLGEIDRAACRKRTEALFSEFSLVEGYLAVYREMLDSQGRGG